MKKLILSVFCLLSAVILSAQDSISQRPNNASVTNIHGHRILPETGDYALGIDVAPFFKYIGNMFNGNLGNNAPSFNGFGSQIYGKYFLSEKTAIRARLSFDFGGNQLSKTVSQDPVDPLNPHKTTVDHMSTDTSGMRLSVGYEFRRGYRRLQGFYGAEFALGFGSKTKTYKYGNAMTEANQTPTFWDFEAANPAETKAPSRYLQKRDGMLLNAGLNGFVGVEYFIAPKIAIGGELQLGLYGQIATLGTTKYEMYNTNSGTVQQYSHRESQSARNNFHFKTEASGSLFVIFHF